MTNPTPTNDLVKRAKLAAMGADDPANYVPRGISAQDVVDLAFCIEAQAAEIERLTAERDALQAKLQERALQELADLGQYTDWQIQAAEREAAAFRAGAEAMREAAAVAADDYGMTYEVTIGRDRGVRTVEYKDGADAIRALPLPDHQSSPKTKP